MASCKHRAGYVPRRYLAAHPAGVGKSEAGCPNGTGLSVCLLKSFINGLFAKTTGHVRAALSLVPYRMSNASPDRKLRTAIVAALRSRAPRLVVFSAIVGAVTFIGLTVAAPGYQAKAIPLAALLAAGTFLLGLAISATLALTGRSRGPEPTANVRPASPGRSEVSHPAEVGLSTSDDEINEFTSMLASGTTAGSATSQASQDSHAAPPPATEADPLRVATIGAMARRIASQSRGGGYRTLVASETNMMGVSSHAIELAKALAETGQSVILIDWAPEGDGVGHALALPAGPGIAELLAGSAAFEQIIRRLPGSEAHVIGTGSFQEADADEPSAERLNLILDALDEAYDQVIVAGRNDAARTFFETIEGRVDCGVLIADPGRAGTVLRDPPGSFLGYEVADIDLIRYDRQMAAAPGQRIIRSERNATATAV